MNIDRQMVQRALKATSRLLIGLIALITAGNVLAARFDAMYVFGDSLSDTGNVFALTGNDPATSVPFSTRYKDGRFANGDVWVDYLARDWGIDLHPSLTAFDLAAGDSVNFSYGGAGSQNGDNTTPGGFPVPGAGKQVTEYGTLLAGAGIGADPDALHIVWAGANDYLLGLNLNPASVVGNILGAVDDLYTLGARNVLVLNLPDLGNTPIARDNFPPGTAAQLTAVSNAHNLALDAGLAQLDANLTGLNLLTLDIHQLFTDIFAAPAAYGFSNTQNAGPASPCLLAPSPTNCSPIPFDTDYFFWDEQHPSTAVHSLIAQAVPVPTTWLLLSLGAGGLLVIRRSEATQAKA